MVNDIIEQRLLDHQLDECDLTLRDLRAVAENFKFTLQSMLHSRVAYPKGPGREQEPSRKQLEHPSVFAA